MRLHVFSYFLLFALAAFGAAETPAEEVIDFYRQGTDNDKRAGIRDRVVVEVEGLEQLRKRSEDARKPIVLYLNDVGLPGVTWEAIDPHQGKLTFLLRRTPESAEAWRGLLGRPNVRHRDVKLSVGLEGEHPIQTTLEKFKLEVFAGWEIGLSIAIILISLALLIILGVWTNMLRNPVPVLNPTKDRPPFSLGRVQLATWFFVVVSAYLVIWALTGELASLTESVLVIIGIGSGTALGAALVDGNNRKTIEDELAQLEEKKTKGQIAAGSPEHQLIEQKSAELTAVKSENPLLDTLKDSNGISLQRVQIFIWTLVLLMIFVASVYKNLAMPEFSGTLLGLMGISSGTYLGFKLPGEKFAEKTSK